MDAQSLQWHGAERFGLSGAFRAPTLNELYRNFRVGNVFTLANPSLTGEHLTGGEAGISAQYWQNRLTLRGNFFWSDINDPLPT